MWWGSWMVALVATLFVVLIGRWFIHGYYKAHKEQVAGVWPKFLYAFEGSATKVVAHGAALFGLLMTGLPEWASIFGSTEAATVIRTFWPEYAGVALAMISLLVVIARNRTLHSD
jgi:hypothetical protein